MPNTITPDYYVFLEKESDQFAVSLSNMYNEWATYKSEAVQLDSELQKFVFATDTRQTTNSSLPWKNTTTRPKLCQIRDNLHANLMATLFGNVRWLDWEASEDLGPEAQMKKRAALGYMYSKINHPSSDFYTVVSDMVLDYIDYGNVFASGSNYIIKSYNNDTTQVVEYKGPQLIRFSPYDIAMSPVAKNSNVAPKFSRSLKTLGDLAKLVSETEDYNADAFEKALRLRKTLVETYESTRATDASNHWKSSAFRVDGFGDMFNYYNGDWVDILDFYGDVYDRITGELRENRIITVMDRHTIIRDIANPTNNGSPIIRHVGWRKRPDNVYCMGPLHNLVGLQYRLDHLENLKSDAMDLSVHRMWKIKGDVEPFDVFPNEKIILGDDGDVVPIEPNSAALNVNLEIQQIENTMEEMAGAPKQAMGFRTPGEKTKFEVQILENNASRMFFHKATWFERNGLEPLLNDMFESGVRNMDRSGETIFFTNEDGVQVPMEITPDDLNAKGRFRPRGASHFVEKANKLQNLITYANSAMASDQGISVHFSGLEMAKQLQELLELDDKVVSPYIRITESQQAPQLEAPTNAAP